MITLLILEKSRQEQVIIASMLFLKPGHRVGSMFHLLNELLVKVAAGLIRCYQMTRFLRRPSCRFSPSCSEYTRQSIVSHGFFKGLAAGVCRIARCHPWNPGGVDEVPETITLTGLVKIDRQKATSSERQPWT